MFLRSMSFQIITFYEFKRFDAALLPALKTSLREAMAANSIKGTIILAEEGFNSTVCGEPDHVTAFVCAAEKVLDTTLVYRSSAYEERPFRKIDVKIKPEIVTLKRPVDMALGVGTHVEPERWNEIISAPDVVVLDTRNDYEFHTGSFAGAMATFGAVSPPLIS